MTDSAVLESVVRRVIQNVLDREGGIANVGDGEGVTRFGQTAQWLRQWRLPPPNTRDEAAMNYRSWIERVNLDVLCTADDQLPDIVIDFAVHSGERVAIAALQRAIGLKADGVIGPKTMTAVQTADRRHLAHWVIAERLELDNGLITDHPDDFARFARGWARRLGAQIRGLA